MDKVIKEHLLNKMALTTAINKEKTDAVAFIKEDLAVQFEEIANRVNAVDKDGLALYLAQSVVEFTERELTTVKIMTAEGDLTERARAELQAGLKGEPCGVNVYVNRPEEVADVRADS